jgi:hypothetical protein
VDAVKMTNPRQHTNLLNNLNDYADMLSTISRETIESRITCSVNHHKRMTPKRDANKSKNANTIETFNELEGSSLFPKHRFIYVPRRKRGNLLKLMGVCFDLFIFFCW